MPLECVAIGKAAQNHTVSGRCERCRIVPAVTEVSFRHPAHRKVGTLRLGKLPALRSPAMRAAEAVWPALGGQIGGARRIVGKTHLKFAQGTGVVSHERTLRYPLFMLCS